MTKSTSCYLYLRVSTEMQIDGYSLDAQRETLEREAKHRGMKIAGVFSDEGKSGKNISGRPEFQRMMSKIEHGNTDRVGYVLVFKLSRFGRNAADILQNLQIMEDYNVHLLAVDEGIDSGGNSGAYGKLLISVMAAVAEIERETIRTQTMAGRAQKAREGKWNGGQAPYGYALSDGKLVVNDTEAEVVRLIFAKFTAASPLGMSGIARWLNESGYQKNVRQTGTNSKFAASFVKGILDNPVYTGRIAYGRRGSQKIEGRRNEYRIVTKDEYNLYDGMHEALVDDETWEKARKRRDATGKGRAGEHSDTRVHLLSGILVCPECGGRMYGIPCGRNQYKKDGTKYKATWYYRCGRQVKETGHSCTYKKYVREDELDAQVKICVREAMRNLNFGESMDRLLGRHDSTGDLQAQVDRLQEAKAKEEARKKKTLQKIRALDPDDVLYDDLYEDLQSILREYAESIVEIDENLQVAEAALAHAEETKITAEMLQEAVRMIAEDMNVMDLRQQQELIGAVLSKIEIYPEKQENGLWIRKLVFKIPIVEEDGEYSSEILSDRIMTIDGIEEVLPKKKHVETVCLLSNRKPDT